MNQHPSASRARQHFLPPIFLIGGALAAIALGIYQWLELLAIRSGGAAPLCAVGENIDCAAVWNSPLANWVHDHSGIPFAGWGIAWAAIILLLAIELTLQTRQGRPGGDAVLALRLTTAAGAAVSLALLAYSLVIGVICPTCFIFYLLAAGAAWLAFRVDGRAAGTWRGALLQSGGLLLIAIALLSYPGRHTPLPPADPPSPAGLPPAAGAKTVPGEDPLAKFLLTLPPEALQDVSDARALYHAAPASDRRVDKNRLISGITNSPVHLIDWIDIRCPHCRHLDEALTEIRRNTPANSWSEEGRHFPLDGECNPNVQRSDDSHISCLAAKVLICLGGSPKGNQVRSALFENQRALTVDEIWRTAAQDAAQRDSLDACVNAPRTAAMLREDIDYAMQHRIEGTPLLVINGRPAPPFPPFIYAMIIAGGDGNAAGFKILPPPRNRILER